MTLQRRSHQPQNDERRTTDVLDFAFIRNTYFPTPAMVSELRHNVPDLLAGYGSRQEVLDEKLAWVLEYPVPLVHAVAGPSQAYPWLRSWFAAGGSSYQRQPSASTTVCSQMPRARFPPLDVGEFASGSYHRLFAYDQGLVIHSGFGKVLYVNYAGQVIGGPYTYSASTVSVFDRDIAASATADLFITWYDDFGGLP
jgi:hypothetical protein